MSTLNRMDRTSAERRRALRRAEREDFLRVIGDDRELDSPDAAMIAASSRPALNEAQPEGSGGNL